MTVYSTAVLSLYFRDGQTENKKPTLTVRGSPYSAIGCII
ncbi:conserved hypothetical protein [Xenorhabdus nematophila F1]|nr:conserved hypothetical protein [Xenorhabdus nematophila F1]